MILSQLFAVDDGAAIALMARFPPTTALLMVVGHAGPIFFA